MKRTLQWGALGLAIVALAAWLATGAHRGWTQTSVARTTVDEVTGIEAVSYEKRFVMGLEILGAAWLAATALGGASLLFRNKNNNNN